MASTRVGRKIKDIGVAYYVWGQNPVQGFGEVRGREFRFRAEGEHWVFEVADWNRVLPSDGGESDYVRRGEDPRAGEMPHDEAARLIEKYARDYFELMD